MDNLSTYILAGEDTFSKEKRIKEIVSKYPDYKFETIYLENDKVGTVNKAKEDTFLYLSTYDFFHTGKILKVVIQSSKTCTTILEHLKDCLEFNILILDVRTSDTRSLTSSKMIKNTKSIVFEKFGNLEEKNKVSTINDLYKRLDDENITFASNEDKKLSANYIFNSSNYSLSSIENEIQKLKILNKKNLTILDIENFISDEFNGNYYPVIDVIFNSENKRELILELESYFNNFDKSNYISFLNIFNATLKDYARYNNGIKCKSGANYYKFKNSKLKIKDIDTLILQLNDLSFRLRISNLEAKEELLYCLYKNIESK